MLRMKQSDYEKILLHAMRQLPEEACGLLAGSLDGAIKEIKKNISADEYKTQQYALSYGYQ